MTIGRVEVWVCSPTKLRKKNNNKPKAEQEPPSLRLRGLKNKPKAEQETAQPTVARFKKPKAEQETAQPTAARFKNKKIF